MKKNNLVKRELAQTLKKMSRTRALDSITVSALTKECGVSRGTFYYHFIDIYDLINWTFDIDIILPLQEHIEDNSQEGWHGITQHCLQLMYNDRVFYCQAVRLEGQNSLQEHMQDKNLESWKLLIGKYLIETAKIYDADTLEYIVKYTAQAIGSMTIEWAKNGMKTPVALMAKMDDVATIGIYGVINSPVK